MKLYQVDNKHDRVNKELDLGELSDKDKQLLYKVLGFINQGLTRYQQYEIAESYVMELDPYDDPKYAEPLPFFENALNSMKHF